MVKTPHKYFCFYLQFYDWHDNPEYVIVINSHMLTMLVYVEGAASEFWVYGEGTID